MSGDLTWPGRWPPQVLVTRPAAQAKPWVDALCAAGLRAASLPLIDIAATPHTQPVRDAMTALRAGDVAMFVSTNAVAGVWAVMGAGWPWPSGVLAAAPGLATAAALRAAGVPQNMIVAPSETAEQFDSEALWERLRHESWPGRRVVVLRGAEGRDWLAGQLRDAGAQVQFVQTYERRLPQWSAQQRQRLTEAQAQPDDVCWLFSSAQAIDNLLQLAAPSDWSGAWALASHPRIAGRAQQAGFGHVIQTQPTPTAVIATLDRLRLFATVCVRAG